MVRLHPHTPCHIDKLYVVVRSDLPAGLKCAQACHAARVFQAEHSELEAAWYRSSNTIAILEASALELEQLIAAAMLKAVPCSLFREEDLNGELTAAAFAPSAKRLLRSCKLALSA